MRYYPEPESQIKDKVKAVLDIAKDFIALKAEVDKLDFDKLVKFQLVSII